MPDQHSRRHALAFNAVAPALREHDQWLPLSVRKAVAESVVAAVDTTDQTGDLVQVGWYCWRCHGIVTQACRSDNVPIHVPAEWAEHMVREIEQRESGGFDSEA